MKTIKWLLIDPPNPLPCSLCVFAPEQRIEEIKTIQNAQQERQFYIRAIISDHIPLSGSLKDILSRPTYNRIIVKDKKLNLYLHKGAKNVIFFEMKGTNSDGNLEFIEVSVISKYLSNCFWSARTAVSDLLDTMMSFKWQPLTIQRLDLFIENDEEPLCQELILPFSEGISWGPLGGIHQHPIFSPYQSLIREAITTNSPYYRFLCAYRLFEGIEPLRKKIIDISKQLKIPINMPKYKSIDQNWLFEMGVIKDFLNGIKTVKQFWEKTNDLRDAAAHFLLNKYNAPIPFSDGLTYNNYCLIGAILLHFSHLTYKETIQCIPQEILNKMQSGSILPLPEMKHMYSLQPDKK